MEAKNKKYRVSELKGKTFKRYSTESNRTSTYTIEDVELADEGGIVFWTKEGVDFWFNYDQFTDLLFDGYTRKTINGGMMYTITYTIKD